MSAQRSATRFARMSTGGLSSASMWKNVALNAKIGLALQQAHTAIPPQDTVIVSRRTNFFRLGETLHGLLHQREQNVRGIAAAQLRLRGVLQKPGVVSAFVRIAQTLKDFSTSV